MAKTVVGLFDTFTEAQNVVQQLVNVGFDRNEISILANDARGEYGASRAIGESSSAAEGAGAGAIGGGVLGGVLGLLVGVGALAIPGIGPVLAAGPLAAALGTAGASTLVGAGIGAAAGGVIGALVGAGIPEEDANFYAEGVRRGGTLLMVKAADDMAQRAYDLMRSNGAVDIDQRSGDWRRSGWSRFEPDAGPYTASGDNAWERSSKVGTTAGAVASAGVGAGADVAGEKYEERKTMGDRPANRGTTTTGSTYDDRMSTSVDARTGQVDYDTSGSATGTARESVEDRFRTFDNDFRTHYQTYGMDSGYTYEQYTPIYRYGYNLAIDPAYQDRDWDLIESEARRRWEERNPNTWERFKDSVRYAWDKARSVV